MTKTSCYLKGEIIKIIFIIITYVLFKESCVNLSCKEVLNPPLGYPTNLSRSSSIEIILINHLFLLMKQTYMLIYSSFQKDIEVINQSLQDELKGKGEKNQLHCFLTGNSI